MHYNLHERIKLKRHIPYRKIFLIVAILVIAAVAYLWQSNHIPFLQRQTPATPSKQNSPA